MFKDTDLNNAAKLGAYRAIAEMMRDRIRKLAVAENDFDRVWATRDLMLLADQFDEAVAHYENPVDAA